MKALHLLIFFCSLSCACFSNQDDEMAKLAEILRDAGFSARFNHAQRPKEAASVIPLSYIAFASERFRVILQSNDSASLSDSDLVAFGRYSEKLRKGLLMFNRMKSELPSYVKESDVALMESISSLALKSNLFNESKFIKRKSCLIFLEQIELLFKGRLETNRAAPLLGIKQIDGGN